MPHHQYVNGAVWQFEIASVWRLAKGTPCQKIPIDHFDLNYDGWYNGTAEPTVQSVLEHAKRALSSDLRHPIIVSSNGRIMDGRHRVFKAILLGKQYVKAHIVDLPELPDRTLQKDDVSVEFWNSLKKNAKHTEVQIQQTACRISSRRRATS